MEKINTQERSTEERRNGDDVNIRQIFFWSISHVFKKTSKLDHHFNFGSLGFFSRLICLNFVAIKTSSDLKTKQLTLVCTLSRCIGRNYKRISFSFLKTTCHISLFHQEIKLRYVQDSTMNRDIILKIILADSWQVQKENNTHS